MTSVDDELAIRRVLATYCHLCDAGDFHRLAEQFAPEGTFAFGEDLARGRAEIAVWFEAHHPPKRRGKHFTVNAVVDVTGERATALSDYVHLRVIDGVITPEIAGRYRDAFVCIDGCWLIERREADMEMLSSRPRSAENRHDPPSQR